MGIRTAVFAAGAGGALFLAGAAIAQTPAAPGGASASSVSQSPSAPPSSAGTVTPSSHQQPKREVEAWGEAEIKAASTHCKAVLKGVHGVMVPEAPIKSGACGAPMVFKLMSIGKGPAVALDPPAILSCDMIATLDKWVKSDLQPLARANLGGPIVKIITMSSYSCRNAYGRKFARLSEHGRANALDIAGFETARSEPALVLTSWGPTAREIRALAAKAEQERKAAEAKAVEEAAIKAASARAPAVGMAATTVSAEPVLRPTLVPGLAIRLPGGGSLPGGTTLGIAPSQLGAPKENGRAKSGKLRPPAKRSPPAGAKAGLPSRQTSFIRKAHETACRRFRTALGPEANRAHKNHLHIDMAQRRNNSSYCE
ncbi:MAG: extensin family protein [Hyphomicrobiaceae bacterium]